MKPTCILTVPRTGSQLLMAHYITGGGYDDAGELLTYYESAPMQFKHVRDVGKFQERYHLGPVKLDAQQNNPYRHVQVEFDRRMYHLQAAPQPLVVKAFVQSDMFTSNLFNIERVFNELDVIVLRRRNVFNSILSLAICSELNTWHPPPEQIGETKQKLSTLKFSVNEFFFMQLIRGHNILHEVTQNLHALSPTARVLYYEDFQANPVSRLNELLGTNFQYETHATTFIENHEAHVENLDRLKELYAKFNITQ